MTSFKTDDERTGRTWFWRIASIAAIAAVFAAIGLFFRRGNATAAILLVVTVPVFGVVFARSWTGILFTALESAKRYSQGVEGDHRHEWYAFKGQRVRVFLDGTQQPWFAANEIAFILALNEEQKKFRLYGPHECGVPESASERCLSEGGLRRLIKYSTHPDAGALGLWLEREVLRPLSRKKEQT